MTEALPIDCYSPTCRYPKQFRDQGASDLLRLDSRTDTPCRSNPTSGGSIYCIRSTDGFFKSNIQELTRDGFRSRHSTADLTREYSLWDAYSVDVQYIDAVQQFVIAINGIPGFTSFRFFNKQLTYLPQHDVDVFDIPWREGAGLVRDEHGHALPHASGRNDVMSLIWYFPRGDKSPSTWDVDFAGVDISIR